MPTINPSLEWIRDHRPAIHAAAKVFLSAATQPPYHDACWDRGDIVGDANLEWGSDEDGKKEIVLGCCLSFQTCGRSLDLGLLNKLILNATLFEAGLDVHPIVEVLKESGILFLVRPRTHEDESHQSLEVFLTRWSFEILSGLRCREVEPEDDAKPTIEVEKTPTPILLLEIGRLFDRTFRTAPWADANKRKKGFSKSDVKFIDSAIEVLKKRLPRIDFTTLQIFDTDRLSVLLLSIFFERKVSGRMVGLDDVLCVALGDPKKQLEVIRKIRGEFVTWGVVESFRCSQQELNEDLFSDLLRLDDGGGGESEIWPDMKIFEQRIRPTSPNSTKRNDDDGPEGEFAWIEN